MRKRECWGLIAPLMAGLLGGFIARQFDMRVLAQSVAPAVLEAKRFVLVDGEGRKRAELGQDEGAVRLEFFGVRGNSGIALSLFESGTAILSLGSGFRAVGHDSNLVSSLTLTGELSRLDLADKDGYERVSLSQGGNQSGLSLSDEHGERLSLLASEHLSSLSLYDRASVNIANIKRMQKKKLQEFLDLIRNTPDVEKRKQTLEEHISATSKLLDDSSERIRFSLSTTSRGTRLSISGHAAQPRAVLGHMEGNTSLSIHDESGHPRAVLGNTGTGTKRPESWIALADKEGKVLWSRP